MKRGGRMVAWVGAGRFVCVLIVALACGDDTSGGTEDYTSPYPTRDLFPPVVPELSELPPPCTAEQSGAGPQISLTQRRSRELYIALGASPDQIGINYRLADPIRVASLSLAFDFDRTIDVTPITIDEHCPTAIPFDTLAAELPNDGVFTGVVTATDARGLVVRETRISFADGSRSLTLSLPPSAPTTGDAWLLFEPAAGKGRLAITRTSWGETIEVEGLPAGPGEIAIVDADLVLDEDSGAISARAGFGEVWRFGVSPWYGAVIQRTTTGAVPLEQLRAPDDDAAYFGQLGTDEALSTERPRILASFLDTERESELGAPCSAASIAAKVLGFGRLIAGDLEAGPGESLEIPIACDAGEETFIVPVTIQSINRRVGTLVLELVEGGSDA